MDYYTLWCDLKDPHRDLEFADNVAAYLGYLKEEGLIAAWQLTRRKLGLGPEGFGEFTITIGTTDLAQLDRAFRLVASRGPEIEGRHAAVYGMVCNLRFGLSRDFPDRPRA